MSIAQTDIVAYASASMPTDDTGTSGGAIDRKTRVSFTDLTANDAVEVISTDASDTQVVTVVGRLASGSIASEALNITGTTAKLFPTNTFERIMSVTAASDAVGTITVRRQSAGATIATIPPGERGIHRLFYNAASDPSSGTDRYEKFFWANNHATLSYLSAVVSRVTDPENVVTFALATTVDDTGSVTNRLAAPGGLTFDITDQAVPGTDLAAGSAVGVWLKLTLTAAQDGFKSVYTTAMRGTST